MLKEIVFFFMFDFTKQSRKKYKKDKWNKFNKNNLFNLNIIIYLFIFIYFFSLYFFIKFIRTKHNLNIS